MDRMDLIILIVIVSIFVIICLYTLFNVLHINYKLKKYESGLETKRKIRKRKNTNVYDLKASRKK